MISRLLRGFFPRSDKRSQYRSKLAKSQRRLRLEPLEDRRMLALVGIIPNFPLIKFDTTGTFTYSGPPSVSATPYVFDMNATPLSFQSNATSAPVQITGTRSVSIDILVNSWAISSAATEPPTTCDIFGTVVANGTTYSGELLTGHVLQFGWQYNSGTSTSQFDFRFETTGGQLHDGYFAPVPDYLGHRRDGGEREFQHLHRQLPDRLQRRRQGDGRTDQSPAGLHLRLQVRRPQRRWS